MVSGVNKNGILEVLIDPFDPNAGDYTEALQEEHYYPFGLKMKGMDLIEIDGSNATNKNPYTYNGKEFVEDIGLSYYGFRMYDPAVGRFTGVDPISDQFAWVSSYNYAENKPSSGIDLHGLQFVGSPMFFGNATTFSTTGLGSAASGTGTAAGAASAMSTLSRAAPITRYSSLTDFSLPPAATMGDINTQTEVQAQARPFVQSKSNTETQSSNDSENFEYFYRAMSSEDYAKNLGYPRTYDNGKGLPFVTTDINYLTDLVSRPEHEGKYDIIVQYTAAEGTTNDLLYKTRRLDANKPNGIKKAKALNYPVRKLERGYLNFGFPNTSSIEHFEPFLINPPTVIFNSNL